MFDTRRFLNRLVMKQRDSKISGYDTLQLNFVGKKLKITLLNALKVSTKWRTYKWIYKRWGEKNFGTFVHRYTGHWFPAKNCREIPGFFLISAFCMRIFKLVSGIPPWNCNRYGFWAWIRRPGTTDSWRRKTVALISHATMYLSL